MGHALTFTKNEQPNENEARHFYGHLAEAANHSMLMNLRLRKAPGKSALTERETQIVVLICDSYESKEISTLLKHQHAQWRGLVRSIVWPGFSVLRLWDGKESNPLTTN